MGLGEAGGGAEVGGGGAEVGGGGGRAGEWDEGKECEGRKGVAVWL